MRKEKPNALEEIRALLTTTGAVKRAIDLHNLLDTTDGMLAMRRRCGQAPVFVRYGRIVRYREKDIDDWCKKRIAERALKQRKTLLRDGRRTTRKEGI